MPKLAREIGEDGLKLSKISYFRERPSPQITRNILAFYDELDPRCPFPDDKLEFIRASIGLRPPSAEQIYQTYSFISALGIDLTAGQKSIEKYGGAYLHFNLNDEQKIVGASCTLSKRLGSDHAPIYKSWRVVNNGGQRHLWRFGGAYFTNEHHLFVVGSRKSKADIRLSIFHVDFDDDQDMLRGMHLAISSYGSILSSRCALVKSSALKRPERKRFLFEPTDPDASHGSSKLAGEVTEFLLGKSEPPYIKIASGS